MLNKKFFVNTLIFCAGTGFGYFIAVKKLKTKYQEDLGEVKDFYMKRISEFGVMPSNFTPPDQYNENDEEDEDDDDDIRSQKEYFDKIKEYSAEEPALDPYDSRIMTKGRPIIKYNKPPLIVVESPVEVDEEETGEDLEEEMDMAYQAELDARAEEFAMRKYENKNNGLPYVINEREYEDGPDEYERHILYYYNEDRVLCEDNDDVVEEEEALVGFDYEDVLEMQTTAWVRNDTLLAMYEIHRLPYSYSKTVANAVETPREREYRIMGRRKEILD